MQLRLLVCLLVSTDSLGGRKRMVSWSHSRLRELEADACSQLGVPK